mmetsp:Transcript_74819/g.86868  ORF Transcript_74819/g.86868 Transcript_74819/m.86868 type:complete len:129 (+) Transcript_74819:24-410(+)
MSNPIAQDDAAAIQNLQWERQKFFPNQFRIFGEYGFVPVQDDKKEEIQKAIENINDIARPTLKSLRYKSNKQELQERVWRKLDGYTMEFNVCVTQSKNIRDTNYCADKYISQLKNDGAEYVKSILKEY